ALERRLVNMPAGRCGDELQQEGEDPPALVQKVKQGKQGDGEAGEEVPDLGAYLGGVGGDRPTAVLQELGDLGGPLGRVDPGRRQMQRTVAQPVDQLVE